MSGEFETFLQFIEANNSFSNAIESKETTLDFNLTIEIIILYLKAKFTTIEKLQLNHLDILKDIIINNNYLIDNNRLIYKGEVIELAHLLDIVKEVRSFKEEKPNNIINLSDYRKTTEPSDKVVVINPKILHFEPPKYKTYSEISKDYSISFNIDKDTKYYIKQTKENFIRLLDTIIDSLLNGNLNTLNNRTLNILSGLLDIISLDYLKTHDPEFLSSLLLPHNKIIMGRYKYEAREVKDLEDKLEKIKSEMVATDRREEYLRRLKKLDIRRNNEITRIKEQLARKAMDLVSDIFFVEEQPSIYNPYLIDNLINSIISNNVEISTKEKNPKLHFFNIKEKETIFYASIPLDSLKRLLDKEDLLSINHQLKKRL